MLTEIFINIIISTAGLPVFLFYRKLLDDKKSWLLLLKIASGTAILGITLAILGFGIGEMYLNFVTPLIAIVTYRPLYLFFKNKLNREPRDTAFNWDSGLIYDRMFNVIYALLTVIPIILITILYVRT